MTSSKIYLNDAPFTASDETIDQILTVLFGAGWRYCTSREGWYDPDDVSSERKSGRDTFLAALGDSI